MNNTDYEINYDYNEPDYYYDEAIDYIAKRCSHSKEIIDEILSLELEYMREIGVVTEAEE